MDKVRKAKLELANRISEFRNLFCNIFSDVKIKQAGKGLSIAEGPNGKVGTVTLANGYAFVDNITITDKSKIFITRVGYTTLCDKIGTSVEVIKSVRAGFAIRSSSLEDRGVFDYLIVEGL
jgi:hypothetical protein